jgi:peptide/nickel transport system substrate-binding protein
MVFSKLLAYQDQAKGTILADLATTLPEAPDGQTITFQLNPNARWPDAAPLNGRSVTSADVKYSIERQLAGDASFVHQSQWSVVDSMEASDDHTITFHLKTPMAAIHHLFADVHSFVVAPEIAGDKNDISASSQLGSGPFQWVEWNEQKFASLRRNPAWYGGNARPNLDGVSVMQLDSSASVEAKFRTKELDAAIVGRALADKLRQRIPDLNETTMGHSQFFGMRFSLVNDPYNDLRFRSAVTYALDRRAMVESFFGGSGGINPGSAGP